MGGDRQAGDRGELCRVVLRDPREQEGGASLGADRRSTPSRLEPPSHRIVIRAASWIVRRRGAGRGPRSAFRDPRDERIVAQPRREHADRRGDRIERGRGCGWVRGSGGPAVGRGSPRDRGAVGSPLAGQGDGGRGRSRRGPRPPLRRAARTEHAGARWRPRRTASRAGPGGPPGRPRPPRREESSRAFRGARGEESCSCVVFAVSGGRWCASGPRHGFRSLCIGLEEGPIPGFTQRSQGLSGPVDFGAQANPRPSGAEVANLLRGACTCSVS